RRRGRRARMPGQTLAVRRSRRRLRRPSRPHPPDARRGGHHAAPPRRAAGGVLRGRGPRAPRPSQACGLVLQGLPRGRPDAPPPGDDGVPQIWTRSSPNWTGAAPTRVRPSKGPGAGPARPSGPWSPRGGWTRGPSPPIMLIASTRRSWTPPEDESMTTEHLDPGTAARDAAPPGYSPADLERFAPEPPKSQARTPFQRDRARVLHSSALRRLGAKTQVLGAGSDDFVRTRLTHSLEVAQVGRDIGLELGCDPDIVDAACLSHDLGHPPFGHNGEKVLDAIAEDFGGFEGNAQTLRLLTRLEPKLIAADRPYGLNLTRASVDAAIKYPWARGQGPDPASPKFGAYTDD